MKRLNEKSRMEAKIHNSENTIFGATGLLMTLTILIFAPAVSFALHDYGAEDISITTRPTYSSLPPKSGPFQGDGTAENPFQVTIPQQMNLIGTSEYFWDKHFILMNDIDLAQYTGDKFNIIGRFYDWSHLGNRGFAGVFDGNNHKITNFTCQTSDSNGVGLFAFVDSVWDNNWPPQNIATGEIRNLTLEDVDVNVPNGNMVGALVGYNLGRIENCCATGRVSATGGRYVGGLLGANEGPWLSDAHFLGDVTGADYVGGLMGYGELDMARCSSAGTVLGINYVGGLAGSYDECDLRMSFSSSSVRGFGRVGGLIGSLGDEGRIFDCFATGDVKGTEYVGGLVGFAVGDIEDEYAEVANSYAAGRVTGPIDTTNGLIGYNQGTVTNSYWDTQTTGIEEPAHGTGLPTIRLRQQSTFTNWDFADTWDITENQTYPILRLGLQADINNDKKVNWLDFKKLAAEWLQNDHK